MYIILGDSADQIEESVLEEIRDNRLIIIKSSKKDLNVLESLLNGIETINYDYCLCIAGHQPNISPDTLKKLIDNSINARSKDIVSILARKKLKYFRSKRLKLPFVCKTSTLKKYLTRDINNLDNLFKRMKKDRILFNRIESIDDLELIDINTCDDYERSLMGKNYKKNLLDSILDFFSLNNLSNNFRIYFVSFIAFIAFTIFLMYFYPSYFFFTKNASSMIETIIQSEAAIIAIVVTLSLVAVQLTASSYSSRVINIFKNSLSLWILIISYLSSIIYGLFVLKFLDFTLNNEIQLWTSLLLSIFTFFALIPFLLDMLDLMKPSKIVEHLENEINDYNVLYAIENDEDDGIQPIIDIIHSSLMKHDYGTLRNGLKAIMKYNEDMYGNTKTFDIEKWRISEYILDHLSRMGELAVNLNNDEAIKQILIAISINGTLSRENLNREPHSAVYSIKHITKLAVKKDLKSAIHTTLAVLQQFSNANSKLIIDDINEIYDVIEEHTTEKHVIDQIFGNRILLEINQNDDEDEE
ncbi:MAG: DUF2254 family protein [Methanobacterium sp.]